VSLAERSRLFLRRNRGWSSRSDRRSRRGWCTATGATSCRVAAGTAVAIDDFVTAQAESLFSLTSDPSIAIAQRTGQSGNDFWAAAAVLANLIADFVSSDATNSFIAIIQTIDEGRHDFWIADAVISIAELTESSTSLTGIASRLRAVNQLGDFTSIILAAFGFARSSTARST
jgi:hypothetical protein